ncbi:MAG: hypothetical protein IJB86_10300 [Clostridia bacterium]|nr:hypothetical protein [Clostridia bacterium]
MVLGEMLPKPPEKRGEVHENSTERLWVDISKVTPKQFVSYMSECAEKGFTTDASKDSFSYSAYNAKGYRLSIRYYDYSEELTIELNAPMELTAIYWPDSAAGSMLPVPKSIIGKFTEEYENSFFVYVGNTSKADYDEYVRACSERGFTVDYEKDENSYSAYNDDGWYVETEYLGGNIMSIDISKTEVIPPAPTEESTTNTTTTTEATTTTAPTTKKPTTTKPTTTKPNTTKPTTTKPTTTKPTTTKPTTTKSNSIGLSADFKAAMDSYESFMNEYVSFMKKYNSNPDDLSMLTEYSNYMSKYFQVVEDFEKWDSTNMNDAEFAYYIDVQARVSKKLLELSE